MIKLEKDRFFAYDMVGEFNSVGEWIHSKRIIKNYELILVIEGIVYIGESGNSYVLNPGDMIILEPGSEHYGTQRVSEPTAFFWFHFYTNLPLPFKTAVNRDVYEIKHLLKRLLHITNTPSYSKNAADALGYMIFEELSQFRNDIAVKSVLAGKITEYVRNKKYHAVTVSQIAKQFGYNPDYIGKLFKLTYGITLKEYITEQRLNHAKDLLLTSSLNIKQISYVLGYTQENLFIKFFIYHEGISPNTFRAQYFNTHINSN